MARQGSVVVVREVGGHEGVLLLQAQRQRVHDVRGGGGGGGGEVLTHTPRAVVQRRQVHQQVLAESHKRYVIA